MTVKDLKEKLNQMPDDLEVYMFSDPEENDIHYLNDVDSMFFLEYEDEEFAIESIEEIEEEFGASEIDSAIPALFLIPE